jgi:hypothetical protein
MQRTQGFALLLAILIINVILAMSLGIFSIALKEVILTTYLKDSQSAFGAADHMLECALYWDMAYSHNGMNPQETIFATSSAYVPPGNLGAAVCEGIRLNNPALPSAGGASWSVPPATLTPTSGVTTFALKFTDGTCADVSVLKDSFGTTVTSNGYNNCNPNNPRRTQRTIEVSTNL